jgi:hypothetical protein
MVSAPGCPHSQQMLLVSSMRLRCVWNLRVDRPVYLLGMCSPCAVRVRVTWLLLSCVCVRVWGVQPSGHTPPIATHCIWLCVVVPLFLLWLLGSQVVTMSPSVWFRRCNIHVPRSVVARARVHAR